MVTTANITPNVVRDGIAYCTGKTVPGAEADLGTPVPLLYGQSVAVSVLLAAGPGATAPTWVVLQSTLDGGLSWYDLAWALWSGTSGQAQFTLSAGAVEQSAVQQTRKAGQSPGGTGFSGAPVGGLFRVTGQTGAGSSASPSPGPSPSPGVASMVATVYYRILGLR